MEKRRVNVRAIVWRDGKILAAKHKKEDGSEASYWAIPGGGLDPLETLQQGVAREVKEETGIDATVGKLLFIQQFLTDRKDFDEELEFFFHVQDSPAFDSIDLASTTHGAEELTRIEFVDPKKVEILPTILNTLDLKTIIEEYPEITIFNRLS